MVVGEENGELDKMLTKVADNYDDEVDRGCRRAMVSLIEPMMIVFPGGAVGFIVIAMFVPLIKLMQGIGGDYKKRLKKVVIARSGTTKQSQNRIALPSLAMTFNVNLFNTFTIITNSEYLECFTWLI